MINNPTGLGLMVVLILITLLIIIIINWKETINTEWLILGILWFVYSFIGVMGSRLPIQFIAFRFWVLLAISTSVLVGGYIGGLINKKVLSYAATTTILFL